MASLVCMPGGSAPAMLNVMEANSSSLPRIFPS
jgi:hypothetical protein